MKNQVVGFLHIELNFEIDNIKEFGDFEDLVLPVSRDINVLTLISRDSLSRLSEQQKNIAMDIFERYKHLFADSNE